jgi:phage terminase small subunit
MKTGRKPKPTALKLLKGNPGRRNLSKPAPAFDPAKPSPPPFLNDDALQEWHRLIDILFKTGVMTETDRAAFAAYCQSYGRWVQAERQIAKL